MKIQDGCDHECAFCIIPKVRGPSRSRTLEDLEGEVNLLVQGGYREVVLCGIHIGEYGLDRETTLAELVSRLTAIPGEFRLRLSSVEATEVGDDLLDAMTATTKTCHHLHMPMQSGDDSVLRAMNRWYDVEEYLAAIDRVKRVLDRPALTGDVIVGFPGESDQAFERTQETVARVAFSRLHVFPFSPRPGTAADALGNRVPIEVIRERRKRLSDQVAEQGEAYRQSLQGSFDRVLFEQPGVGLTDRYQRCSVGALSDRTEELCDVRIDEATETGLRGSPLRHATRTA